MKTSLFIVIVISSGALAGLVHGSANLVIVEPYLDSATGIEQQGLLTEGDDEARFWAEYENYRMWQKGGQVIAGILLGVSMGALFGIVYAISRESLPGGSDLGKSLLLAGIMWAVVYFVPFLKYPANLPTVGEPETLAFRTILYLSFVAISGIGAVIFYKISKRFTGRKKLYAFAGYCVLIISSFVILPNSPDDISLSQGLVDGFRIASILGVSAFWVMMGLLFGVLWSKYKPHIHTV